jgi:putative transposase
MPNTFTQIYIQIVFTVQGRHCLIKSQHREEIEKFISGIIKNRSSKMLAIYCMPDHTHILIGINPNQSISDLVRDIKAGSSKFINEQKWYPGKFRWQEGYGAFSYSKSQIDEVVKYILNQPQKHQKKSFKEEYLILLNKFEIEYDEKYLFEWIDL